MLTGSLTMYMY